jgi:F-type H+-transporting ATPase subunit b
VTFSSPARYRRVFLALSSALALGLTFRAAAVVLAAQESGQAHEETASGESGHESGWSSTIAKTANFVVLVGVLVYFLKSPIAGYLRDRGDTIRKDLVDAAALRAEAEKQLGEVRTRLAALPAELESLRVRGRDELVGERERLKAATAREKEHILDRTRRDIDLQVRLARRSLVEQTTQRAMALARTRLEHEMTAEDQARLVDRYVSEVRA